MPPPSTLRLTEPYFNTKGKNKICKVAALPAKKWKANSKWIGKGEMEVVLVDKCYKIECKSSLCWRQQKADTSTTRPMLHACIHCFHSELVIHNHSHANRRVIEGRGLVKVRQGLCVTKWALPAKQCLLLVRPIGHNAKRVNSVYVSVNSFDIIIN